MAELDAGTTPESTVEVTTGAEEVLETTGADTGADEGNEGQENGEGTAGEESTQQTDPDLDLEDVDYEGAKFKAPKGVKDAMLRYADYTQKTQDVAASRKELEQERQALTQQVQVQQATLGERVELSRIKTELDTYAKVDWNKLHAEDPAAFALHSHHRQELKDQAEQIGKSIEHKERQALDGQRTSYAKKAQESDAVIARDFVKDWSRDKANKLVGLAESVGQMPRQAMVDALVMFPGAAKILDLALVGQQFLEKQKATPAPKTTPKTVANPVPTVGNNTKPASRALADLPMKEFVEQRNKAERERRNRRL